MATPDEDWSKAVAEEVLGEENATNENVDAFYESDRSLILDKASPPAGLPRFIALRSRRPPTPRCCRASRAQVPSPLVVWRALTLVSRNEPLFVDFFVLYFPLSSTAFRVLQEVPKPSLSHWAS